jgi:hypothetical protein
MDGLWKHYCGNGRINIMDQNKKGNRNGIKVDFNF